MYLTLTADKETCHFLSGVNKTVLECCTVRCCIAWYCHCCRSNRSREIRRDWHAQFSIKGSNTVKKGEMAELSVLSPSTCSREATSLRTREMYQSLWCYFPCMQKSTASVSGSHTHTHARTHARTSHWHTVTLMTHTHTLLLLLLFLLHVFLSYVLSLICEAPAWSSFLQNWDRRIINKIYYYYYYLRKPPSPKYVLLLESRIC